VRTHAVLVIGLYELLGNSLSHPGPNAPMYLAYGEMYLIQHYVMKFVINLLQVLVLIFMDGDVPLVPSFGFDISLLVRFARFYNNVSDFSDNNLVITEKKNLHIQR